jgi:hypothetical protein
MRWITSLVLAASKETALIALLDLIPSVALLLLYGIAVTDTLGLIFLLEATVLMLIGGAMELSTSPTARRVFSLLGGKERPDGAQSPRETQKGAALYTLTGFFFFLGAVVMAVVAG